MKNESDFNGRTLTVTPPLGPFSGVGTKIDPTLCRADRMVGQVLGAVGALPEIFTELEISYFLLRRLLGVRTEGDKKAAKVGERNASAGKCSRLMLCGKELPETGGSDALLVKCPCQGLLSCSYAFYINH